MSEPADAVPKPRRRLFTRAAAIRLAVFLGIAALLCVGAGACMMSMPGRSHRGPLPPLTPEETEIASRLREDVRTLASDIGIRNAYSMDRLDAAADYVERRMKQCGPSVRRTSFGDAGRTYFNIELEVRGISRPGEIVVFGAHYDSAVGTPGANDNASGVAALLALARAVGPQPRTVRFVAWPNEEMPFFKTELMGSLVYAQGCALRKERIVAMLSLETMGYFSDAEGSQKYPPPFGLFYPSRGDFIGIVGPLSSRSLVRRVVRLFRESAQFPCEGGALPGWVPGVSWSDHWAFDRVGFPAVMVTDTAPFRYPQYHRPGDTPEKIDYERLARVVAGLARVARSLADPAKH